MPSLKAAVLLQVFQLILIVLSFAQKAVALSAGVVQSPVCICAMTIVSHLSFVWAVSPMRDHSSSNSHANKRGTQMPGSQLNKMLVV